MDPNAALAEIRRMVEDEETYEDNKDQIISMFLGLDDWLSAGGFFPAEWQSAFHVSPEGNAALKEMKGQLNLNKSPHNTIGGK